MKSKIVVIIFIFVFFIVSSISVGYSAFNTELSISGEAIIRRDADIRITNLELISNQNGAYEKFSSKYSKSLTSMSVVLPNTNSSITYRVTVINKTSSYFTPGEIKSAATYNTNVSYVLDGFESYGVYQGSTYTFNITFTTSLVNQECDLTLMYDFKTVSKTLWNFNYTGDVQSFPVPYNAAYKIELWGAQGGDRDNLSSLGGYTSGKINVEEGTLLYLYVGGKGTSKNTPGNITIQGGYNGGANGRNDSIDNRYYASGGGATDIRLVNGNWDNFDSLKSRIMVAAGGGATLVIGDTRMDGGSAGGLIGYDGTLAIYTTWGNYGTGGTQTYAGYNLCESGNCSSLKYEDGTKTGIGGFGYGGTFYHSAQGGGGGYYGGGASAHVQSAGGGSSFISGHDGCNAIKENSTVSNIIHTGDSKHYSNYVFSNTIMIDGKGCTWTNQLTTTCTGQVQPDGTTKSGHTGDGYARITVYPVN